MKVTTPEHVALGGWRLLLRGAALTLLVLLAGTGLALRDGEALALAAVVGAGLVLLRVGRQRLGTLLLGLLSVNTAGWMIPGVVSNLRHGDGVAAAILPAAIAVSALAVAAGAVGSLTHRRDAAAGRRAVRWVTAGAVVALTVVAVAALWSRDATEEGFGGIVLETENMAFSETSLETDAGQIDVRVRNGDLFWHTFTIRELDVDVRVPVRGTRSVVFDAAPGTYEFVCAIPGHPQAGMKGVLVVR